jgi:hypothetical protein
MFINGNFVAPVFQSERVLYPFEGTNDKIWEETYIQWRTYYARAALSSVSSRHASCHLIGETPITPLGPENSPLIRFIRIYAETPATRTEPVQVSYAYPGLSTSDGFGWHHYGLRDPFSKVVAGTNTISYVLGASAPAMDPLTIPTYSGQPVDYIGPGPTGYTSPASEPTDYTVACQISRWRGEIWQKIVQTVKEPSLYL